MVTIDIYYVIQAIVSQLQYFASSMQKNPRQSSLVSQKGSEINNNRQIRSQTVNKNSTFFIGSTLDESNIKFKAKSKPKPQYQIVDSFIRNDKIYYVGEYDGKRKNFNRSAFMSDNQLFLQLMKFYGSQVGRMLKNLQVENMQNQRET